MHLFVSDIGHGSIPTAIIMEHNYSAASRSTRKSLRKGIFLCTKTPVKNILYIQNGT